MIITQNPKKQLIHQINTFYYDGLSKDDERIIDLVYDNAINKLERCFSCIKNKYYHDTEEGGVIFNPLHVAQWTMFLYEISHEIYNMVGSRNLCDKIYGISKTVSSADILYAVEMPNIWFFDHPQGSVMGRAEYGDFFCFSQGCTVGNNKGIYPRIGKHVSMSSGSKILGNCNIGDHVILAANSYVLDEDIPSFSIVFGMHPNICVKRITQEKFNELTSTVFDGNE